MPSYKNGNYIVTILEDGTKIRRTEENNYFSPFIVFIIKYLLKFKTIIR